MPCEVGLYLFSPGRTRQSISVHTLPASRAGRGR